MAFEKNLEKKKHVQLSHEKNTACLGDLLGMKYYSTHLNLGIIVNHYTDPFKTTQDAMESDKGFFCGSIVLLERGRLLYLLLLP